MSSQSNNLNAPEWVKSSSHSLVNERDLAIYMMGKEKGAEEYKEQIDDILKHNFTQSYEDTTRVLERLKDYQLNIISARLKIESIRSLKIILAIQQSDLLSEKIEDVYDFIYDLETQSNNSEYRVDFSIIKANENFDDQCVEGDGYIYKHRLLLNEKSPRTA